MAPEAVVYHFNGETETKQVKGVIRVATARDKETVIRIEPLDCGPENPGDETMITPGLDDGDGDYVLLDNKPVKQLTLRRDKKGAYVKGAVPESLT